LGQTRWYGRKGKGIEKKRSKWSPGYDGAGNTKYEEREGPNDPKSNFQGSKEGTMRGENARSRLLIGQKKPERRVSRATIEVQTRKKNGKAENSRGEVNRRT